MKKMTTIKLSPKTKSDLGALRLPGESYDETMQRLLQRQNLARALAKGYEEQEKYHKELLDEWSRI